jgi:PIN domain nuclease of toxin-antitoxin system
MGGHEVTYLLDTSVWLMSALRPQVLPDEIEEIIADTGETLGRSIFSLWEVAKKRAGKAHAANGFARVAQSCGISANPCFAAHR